MINRPSQQPDHSHHATQSRRGFLRRSLGAALATALTHPARILGQPMAVSSLEPHRRIRSNVIRVSSERVLPVRVVQRSILKDAVGEGLKLLSGQNRVADAWHTILDPKDVVLLKFNQSAADRIGTTPATAEVLVESLVESGWAPENLMLLEAGPCDTGLLRKTRRPDLRWQGTVVPFGSSGADVFIAALDQATAVVNVPFLKTHHLATMTSCMKNLSHGLIRHPSRFHANQCDPAIAEIVSSPPISDKLRLNIVNALRLIMDGGSPGSNSELIETAGVVLMGSDPVACDSVGFGLLNEVRSIHGMPPLLAGAALPMQLQTAERLGIGNADLKRIETPAIRL